MNSVVHNFDNGDSVIFYADGRVELNLDNSVQELSKDQFLELMPLAQHVYHQRCQSIYGSSIGSFMSLPQTAGHRKPGRPRGSKSTAAKKSVRKPTK